MKKTATLVSVPVDLNHCGTLNVRTKQALKRQLISGTYNSKNPIIVPFREDRRYRTWKTVQMPEANAVILYIMDVSRFNGRRAERDGTYRIILD